MKSVPSVQFLAMPLHVAAGINSVVWNAQVAKAAENHARYTLTNAANPDSSFSAEDLTKLGYANLDVQAEVMSITVVTKDPKTMLRCCGQFAKQSKSAFAESSVGCAYPIPRPGHWHYQRAEFFQDLRIYHRN